MNGNMGHGKQIETCSEHMLSLEIFQPGASKSEEILVVLAFQEFWAFWLFCVFLRIFVGFCGLFAGVLRFCLQSFASICGCLRQKVVQQRKLPEISSSWKLQEGEICINRS